MNIDLGVKGATEVVVTTVDTTSLLVAILNIIRITRGNSSVAVVIHICLVNITGYIIADTITTTEDTVHMDGRAHRHINHCSTSDTFLVASTEDILDTTFEEINNG